MSSTKENQNLLRRHRWHAPIRAQSPSSSPAVARPTAGNGCWTSGCRFGAPWLPECGLRRRQVCPRWRRHYRPVVADFVAEVG